MADELERAVSFIERMQDRMAERIVPYRYGTALFHDRLPRVWSLNFLRIERDRDELTADAVIAEADRLQGGAGLRHRKIRVDDERVGRRLEPTFRGLNWDVERDLVMTHRRGLALASAAASVVEVNAVALRPGWEQGIRSAPWARDDEEAVRQQLDAQDLRRRAVSVRYFAASVGGRFVSECQLFSVAGTAQVESVHTLEEHRGHGLAQSVIGRAVEEAVRAGNELVFLLADEDDWPKELYRKLGFEEIGRVWDFVRTPP